jgi:FkbM family methyltransferase
LWLAKVGNAERFEMDLWSDSLRPGMVVADVGANLGLYTLLAAERVGPAGRVHSFEPDPQNAALLRRNVAANVYNNVVLHEAAVADRQGVVALHRCPEHHGDHRIYGVA